MFSGELIALATEVLAKARAKGLKIVTAESCTGGLIAGLLTEIPGSSDVFDRGFVTYSNDAKEQMLGVPHNMLVAHGAVSSEVAEAMARGAIQNSLAHIGVSVTGIAGPGGGSAEKPVGTVHIAVMTDRETPYGVMEHHSFGDTGRAQIRLATIEAALKLLQRML